MTFHWLFFLRPPICRYITFFGDKSTFFSRARFRCRLYDGYILFTAAAGRSRRFVVFHLSKSWCILLLPLRLALILPCMKFLYTALYLIKFHSFKIDDLVSERFNVYFNIVLAQWSQIQLHFNIGSSKH